MHPSPDIGWCFDDTGKQIDHRRPCARCRMPPTPEGYDACLGYIPRLEAACCGHGVEQPSIGMLLFVSEDEFRADVQFLKAATEDQFAEYGIRACHKLGLE